MNQRKSIWKGVVFIGIMIILFLHVKMGVLAEEDKHIRVGFPIQEGFSELDENGNYVGYNYDYLMEISRYTDWEYEFIMVDGTLNEQLISMMDMLKNGEIDILGALVYSEEMADIYDYCGYNYGTSYYTLCVSEENVDVTRENYYLKPELKVGVSTTRNVINKELDQFAQTNDLHVQQVLYKTQEDMIDGLKRGEVDMILIKDVVISRDDLRIIARFSPIPFYFATTKGNKEVVTGLNMALVSITKANPYFTTNLQEKYFSNESDKLVLSQEEIDYIQNAGTISAVMMGGKDPIQNKSAKGECSGISVDLLSYITELTGLSFDIQIADTMEELQSMLQSGEADIMLGNMEEFSQLDRKKWKVSSPYLIAPVCIVLTQNGSSGELGNHIAVPSGLIIEDSGIKISYYNNTMDCLKAVHEKKVDYCYSNTYTAQYYMSHPEIKNLVILSQDDSLMQEYCFAVQYKRDGLLLGILNKVVQSLSNGEIIRSFLYNNAYQIQDVTLMAYLRMNTFDAVMIGLVMILSIWLILLMNSRWRDKRNAQIRSLENARYEQIGELTNEFLFEYNIKKDTLQFPEISAEFLQVPKTVEQASKTIKQPYELFQKMFETEDGSRELCVGWMDGTKRWIRIITKVIADKKGTPIYVIGKLMDIQMEVEEKEKLMRKAQKDSLTGVYNIATFRELVMDMRRESKQTSYALIILDLDHFKHINDTYGHYTGDFVLKSLGEILNHTFRKEDLKGRLGGDEFVIFMRYEGRIELIEQKCRLLKQKIGEITFENQEDRITASIGAALVSSRENFDELYQDADAALYEVKKNGRNGFKIYQRE